MGGDRAPDEIVAGALDAAADGIEIDPLRPRGHRNARPRAGRGDRRDRDAREARRGRAREAGLVARRRCRAVAEGRADAVLSAGNTGAMLAAGLLHLRRLPGCDAAGDRGSDSDAQMAARPSCSTPARTPTRARSTCSSSRTWARSSPRRSSSIARPEVRLLSIGEEPEKGNQLTLEAHALLADERPRASPATPRAATCSQGAADVVVCDGFTGNIALKLLEGTIKTLLDALRTEILATPRGQARRAPDPARGAPAAHAARPGHVRRRVPARPPRPLRDRARQLVPHGDRERDPARRARRRARRRRPPRLAVAGSPVVGRLYDRRAFAQPNEKARSIWQRRVKKSSSESRKS